MALSEKLRQRLELALSEGGGRDGGDTRLQNDARRLWRRIHRLMTAEPAINALSDPEAMELACFALQLPLLEADGPTQLGRRAEAAADRLEMLAESFSDAPLLDRTVRLLLALPQRSSASDDAHLLADAVNLEDFGLIGLSHQIMHYARPDQGLEKLIQGCEKREQYGYWDARLKEFHYESARRMAQERLKHYRAVCQWLGQELRDEQE